MRISVMGVVEIEGGEAWGWEWVAVGWKWAGVEVWG